MADPFAGVASPVDPFNGVASPVQSGLFGRISDDYRKRVANDQVSRDAFANGQQSAFSTGLQYLGQGGGMVNDVVNEGIKSVDSMIPNQVINAVNPFTAVTSNPYVKQALGSVAATAPDTGIGTTVDSLRNQYPVTARNLDAVGNTVSAVGTLYGAAQAAPGLKNTAQDLFQSGKQAFDAKKLAGIQDVVLPKQTAAEIANTALQRTSGGGLLNKQVYTPNDYEVSMITTAREAGVKPTATLETNIQTANSFKNAEAQRLKAALDKANVAIPPSTLNQAGVEIAQKIASNPLIDENSSTIRKILQAGQDAIDKNPKTAAGILQARKDFDYAIGKFQPSAFDTEAPATAFRAATKEVRQGMNGIVTTAVPNADVAASLAKQSHMYDVIDNMAGKLSAQPDGRFARFFDTKTGKVIKYGAAATGATAAGRSALHAVSPKQSYSDSGE